MLRISPKTVVPRAKVCVHFPSTFFLQLYIVFPRTTVSGNILLLANCQCHDITRLLQLLLGTTSTTTSTTTTPTTTTRYYYQVILLLILLLHRQVNYFQIAVIISKQTLTLTDILLQSRANKFAKYYNLDISHLRLNVFRL